MWGAICYGIGDLLTVVRDVDVFLHLDGLVERVEADGRGYAATNHDINQSAPQIEQ